MTSPEKKPFKIKVLPKGGEGSSSSQKKPAHIRVSRKSKKSSKRSGKQFPLGVAFLMVAGLALGGLYYVNKKPLSHGVNDPSPSRSEDRQLTKYLQDAQKKSELQSLKVEVENQGAQQDELPAFMPLDTEDVSEARKLGVELESDPSMERIYDELYGSSPDGKWLTPEERISARLSERKWLYEFEKEERKMYIRNFIEAAKAAGYEIQINEDLIVTSVKPITSRPKVPLDKVLENMYPAK